MVSRQQWCVLLALLASVWSGCNQKSSSNESEVELPAWMTEEKKSANSGQIQLASHTTSAFLGLSLQPGDQFPLKKTVQQHLTQHSQNGMMSDNHSQLEMMLAISVLEKRDERVRLAVRYDRVRYQHQIADESVHFDSSVPQESVSPQTIAYRDMVNDGFSFWIGNDNQIVEVDGLSEFIERCLRNVPPEMRQDVVLGIEASSGDSGIANFVDNTIGLLPYGKKTSPGDSWDRRQHIDRPLPMHVSNLYTLKELTDKYAVIDIRGTITPSTSLSNPQYPGLHVIVNGGNTLGTCTIYRETGLPKESRIDRTIEMSVHVDNSVQFRQTKRIITTIESFPSMNSNRNPVVRTPGDGAIQQASGVR